MALLVIPTGERVSLAVTESPIKGEAFADSIRVTLWRGVLLPSVEEPKFDMIFVLRKNFTGVFRSFRNAGDRL